MKFGDIVTFTSEYRSCKPETVDVTQKLHDVADDMVKKGIECEETIQSKSIFKLKRPKQGIYLGTFTIHTGFLYEYVWEPMTEYYRAHKDGFIEVAEVRCEGIRKTYYVPLDDLKLNEGAK